MDRTKQIWKPRTTNQNSIITITLSDSDSDSLSPFIMETQNKSKRKKVKRCNRKNCINRESSMSVDLSSTILIEDSGESTDEYSVQKRSRTKLLPPADLIPLNAEKKNSVKFYEIDGKTNSATKVVGLSNFSTVISSLNNTQINRNSSEQNAVNETIILSDSPPPPDFISSNSEKEKENIWYKINGNDLFAVDVIHTPIVIKPKCLRPIAIDGSNVARAHGSVSNTFSCKGIKIAVDYFLQRGHQQVIAFLPHFRKKVQEHKSQSVLTTDQFLLNELEKGQHAVFTPSRCYDDRFIVEYATKTGGIILSNDNFRDIAAESEEFRKTINERLLMFCFVGDMIMIPQDPLGREGPSLENFLSFPT